MSGLRIAMPLGPLTSSQAIPQRIWHVAVGREKRGPLTHGAVEELISARTLHGRSYCWRPGMSNWVHLETISEFQPTLAAATEAPSALDGPATPDIGAADPAEAGPNGERKEVGATSVSSTLSTSSIRRDLNAVTPAVGSGIALPGDATMVDLAFVHGAREPSESVLPARGAAAAVMPAADLEPDPALTPAVEPSAPEAAGSEAQRDAAPDPEADAEPPAEARPQPAAPAGVTPAIAEPGPEPSDDLDAALAPEPSDDLDAALAPEPADDLDAALEPEAAATPGEATEPDAEAALELAAALQPAAAAELDTVVTEPVTGASAEPPAELTPVPEEGLDLAAAPEPVALPATEPDVWESQAVAPSESAADAPADSEDADSEDMVWDDLEPGDDLEPPDAALPEAAQADAAAGDPQTEDPAVSAEGAEDEDATIDSALFAGLSALDEDPDGAPSEEAADAAGPVDPPVADEPESAAAPVVDWEPTIEAPMPDELPRRAEGSESDAEAGDDELLAYLGSLDTDALIRESLGAPPDDEVAPSPTEMVVAADFGAEVDHGDGSAGAGDTEDPTIVGGPLPEELMEGTGDVARAEGAQPVAESPDDVGSGGASDQAVVELLERDDLLEDFDARPAPPSTPPPPPPIPLAARTASVPPPASVPPVAAVEAPTPSLPDDLADDTIRLDAATVAASMSDEELDRTLEAGIDELHLDDEVAGFFDERDSKALSKPVTDSELSRLPPSEPAEDQSFFPSGPSGKDIPVLELPSVDAVKPSKKEVRNLIQEFSLMIRIDKQNKRKKVMILSAIVVLIAGLVTAGWYFQQRAAKEEAARQAAAQDAPPAVYVAPDDGQVMHDVPEPGVAPKPKKKKGPTVVESARGTVDYGALAAAEEAKRKADEEQREAVKKKVRAVVPGKPKTQPAAPRVKQNKTTAVYVAKAPAGTAKKAPVKDDKNKVEKSIIVPGFTVPKPNAARMLSREKIKNLVKQKLPKFSACKNTLEPVRTTLSFNISASGMLSRIAVDMPDGPIPAVQRCIIRKVKQWLFPPIGKEQKFIFRFNLQ